MTDDVLIDLVRTIRAAYEDGIREGRRRRDAELSADREALRRIEDELRRKLS